jgi:SAM-dependent MidA family methyltransferase
MVFDYCTRQSTELISRPWREWLRTYRNNDRGEHYLRDPGSQDITAQVCVDQLPAPSTIEFQHEFLRRFGLDDLVDEGRRAWSDAAARPDVAAIKMRSRVGEAEALTDPAGLGAFSALCWIAQGSPQHGA